ncbi:MAG TPA: class I SAM-dependent methyltransferase [Candidatus Polarisedimenticolia bacterium]|nr:class I SAM-dependent methyltransferase [Candidatus Polarisedimenticolia bacterium]
MARSPFLRLAPPGHFYSPIPDLEEIAARSARLFRRDVADCPGIDLRVEAQIDRLDRLAAYYGDLPFPDAPGGSTRYHYDNGFFSHGDAIILYSTLRHDRPRRVIEVGSGFSSALMLDVNELFLDESIRFTFIEPHPDRLLGLLTADDRRRHAILATPVQEVPLDLFRELQAGDLLFIDSSHVVKIGSDVTRIVFDILPVLRPGVLIHFHDVLWPFEYPEEWLLKGRAWNEAYFLRAFLQYNRSFEIEYFNSYVAGMHGEVLRRRMPLCLKNPGGSLFIRKSS